MSAVAPFAFGLHFLTRRSFIFLLPQRFAGTLIDLYQTILVFPYPQANLTELRLGLGNYAIGFSTDKRDQGVRFQGFHSPNLLVIIDEAPGINADVWQAIEGIRAGGNVHLLVLGNPTIAGGPFHDAFTANREGWRTFTIDAFDTPNFGRLKRLAGGSKDRPVASAPAVEAAMLELLRVLPAEHNAITYSSRPYLVSVPWARERLREWGTASPLWQSRVRGQFPEQSEDALISLAWLEAAKTRTIENATTSELEAGVDVAGPGDDECVVYVRRGGQLIDMLATAEPEPRGRVLAFIAPYKPQLISVNVDAIGIGYNFGLHIRDHGYPVNNVNVGEAAPFNPERFQNMKAELYWALRERFERGEIAGLTDETTISQLATIRYVYTPQGRVKIESKDDARKRGVKSPDRAEALMLCFGRIRPGIWRKWKRDASARSTGRRFRASIAMASK